MLPYASLLGMKPAAYKRHRTRRGRIKAARGYAIGDLENMLCKVDGLVSPEVDHFDSARWFSGGRNGKWRLPVTPANSKAVDQDYGSECSGFSSANMMFKKVAMFRSEIAHR